MNVSQDWQPAILYYVSIFAEVAVAILGAAACYHANRTGDDKDFIARYFCLSLPVAVSTTTVLVIPGAILVGSLVHSRSTPLTLGIEDLVGILAIGVVYYWRLWRWTRRVAQPALEPGERDSGRPRPAA